MGVIVSLPAVQCSHHKHHSGNQREDRAHHDGENGAAFAVQLRVFLEMIQRQEAEKAYQDIAIDFYSPNPCSGWGAILPESLTRIRAASSVAVDDMKKP